MIDFRNVIILILSTKDNTYNEMKTSQRRTWVKAANDAGIKCFFYEGDTRLIKSELNNDVISVPCDDSLASCSLKFKMTLNCVLDNYPHTKLIYRTNLSSYIDVDNFIAHLSDLPDPELEYSGYTGSFNKYKEYVDTFAFLKRHKVRIPFRKVYQFCSGSGMFLGCEYFDKILLQTKYDRYIDDVMIRLAIKVKPKLNIDRFDFVSHDDYLISKETYRERVNKGLFHYRFKTDNRTNDAKLLYLCHDKDLREFLCTKGE
jgi:hypothetical protein